MGKSDLRMLHDRPMTREEALGYAETMEGRVEDMTREAIRLGLPRLLAGMDQIEAQLRDLRDVELAALLADTNGFPPRTP